MPQNQCFGRLLNASLRNPWYNLQMKKILSKINWVNLLFIAVLTPIGAVLGLIYLSKTGDWQWQTLLMSGIVLCCTGLGITVGYHRLFSHDTFMAVWPVRLFFALVGAAAFQGSVLEWCTDHRNHHLHTDTDKDPYSISKGFWFAHFGWLMVLDKSKRNYANVEDLAADPILRFQHKFYIPLALFMGFGVPTLLAACWGDALGGLILAGFVRTVVNHHATFAINSVCHVFGNRPYSEKQSARDNWFTALFTFGEGYHNFHHQFPRDYRNGIRFYHFDPSKWLINLMSWTGLAYDLKKIDESRILRYRMMQDKADTLARVNQYSQDLMQQASDVIKPLYDRIMEQMAVMRELRQHYRTLKRSKLKDFQGKVDEYRAALVSQKIKLKMARYELKKNLVLWKSFMKADQVALLTLTRQYA